MGHKSLRLSWDSWVPLCNTYLLNSNLFISLSTEQLILPDMRIWLLISIKLEYKISNKVSPYLHSKSWSRESKFNCQRFEYHRPDIINGQFIVHIIACTMNNSPLIFMTHSQNSHCQIPRSWDKHFSSVQDQNLIK